MKKQIKETYRRKSVPMFQAFKDEEEYAQTYDDVLNSIPEKKVNLYSCQWIYICNIYDEITSKHKRRKGNIMKNKSIQCLRCEKKYNSVVMCIAINPSTEDSWCEECWESICEEEKNEEEK